MHFYCCFWKVWQSQYYHHRWLWMEYGALSWCCAVPNSCSLVVGPWCGWSVASGNSPAESTSHPSALYIVQCDWFHLSLLQCAPFGEKPIGWVLDWPSDSHFLGGIAEIESIWFGDNKSQLLDGVQSDLGNTVLLMLLLIWHYWMFSIIKCQDWKPNDWGHGRSGVYLYRWWSLMLLLARGLGWVS